MAPTIKWQRWDSASYDWLGATAADPLPSIQAELDAWITAVNANASNTGRQLTRMRGIEDSTGGDYAGITIRAGANSNTDYGYMFYGTFTSASVRVHYFGNTYQDDTSNGGYGNITGGPADTSVAWYGSGIEANFLIITGTVDGQEYFLFGPSFGSSPSYLYQDGFAIMKMNTGDWCLLSGDGGAAQVFTYFNDSASTGWSTVSRDSTSGDGFIPAQSYSYGRFGIVPWVNVPSFIGNAQIYAASPDLYEVSTSANFYLTGARRVMTDIDAGGNVYMLTSFHKGPSVLVDLRP